LYSMGFITVDPGVARVHAPSLTTLSDGRLLAVWYGGSREGAADVALYSAILGRDGSWSPPEVLIDRQALVRDLGRNIRKLGNAVLLSDGAGNVWTFFVSTSVGGWSTSAINMVRSSDDGRSWSSAVRLWSSPFLNVSTLVKGHPFFYADGTIGLPVYHELAGKFGELLRVDRQGRVLDKRRLTHLRRAIQPDVARVGDRTLCAVLRNTTPMRELLIQYSHDGGRSWSSTRQAGLPNPDAAVSMIGVENGRLLLAYNDSNDDRDSMDLAVSDDGGWHWRRIHRIEREVADAAGNKAEFSYPWLIRGNDGVYHLLYTWKRQRIRHIRFNDAWIEAQLR